MATVRLLLISALLIISCVAAAGPPQLPTPVYGRVMYEDGRPAGGINITAQWVDGEVVKSSLVTDESGYYFFTSQINPSSGKIQLSIQNELTTLDASPGFVLQAEDMIISSRGLFPAIKFSLPALKFQVNLSRFASWATPAQHIIMPSRPQAIKEQNLTRVQSSAKTSGNFLPVISALIAMLLIVYAALHRPSGLQGILKSVLNSSVRKAMNKELAVISSKATLQDALDLADQPVIMVMDKGKLGGVVTAQKLLLALLKNPAQASITTAMHQPVSSCKPFDSLKRAAAILSKSDFIAVELNGKVQGTLDWFGLLIALQSERLGIDNPPSVRTAMKAPVMTTGHKTTLGELSDAFAEGRMKYAVVVDGRQLLGMITLREVIAAFAQGADREKTFASHIMSYPLVSKSPGTSILEAFSVMDERRLTHLPVILQGELAGVVSIRDLGMAYVDFLQHASPDK